jgi:hypothetical protein
MFKTIINRKALSPPLELFTSVFLLYLGLKIEILYFTSPRTARKGNSDLSKGEVNGKLFRLKLLVYLDY